MAECTESKIDIRGCKVHMRRGGSGEPALFLHGASGVAGWIPAFKSLDELDLDGVHLIGNSLGGWLAMEIAVRSCTRLKSLTLVGAAGIRIKGKPIADIFMMDPDDLVREIFVDQSFADNILNMDLTEEQTDIQIRNRVATARLGWQPRLFNPNLRKWLHRIKVPTHVIWGDSDKIVDPVYAAEFGRVIAGAQVTMIDQAGHLPHIEKPEPFVDAVTGFLRSKAA